MAVHWYALQTRALKEGFVAQQLEARAFPVFYPRLTVKPVNPRARTVRPFFPCYLFVRADLAEVGMAAFQYLPHTVGLVCFGDTPAVVEPELLEGIAGQLDQINSAGGELFLRLQRGDRVQITHGVFAGYEAIFDGRLRDTDRVRLLLELIGCRQAVVELQVNQIQRL
jgi:transcription antitermination factor NusG